MKLTQEERERITVALSRRKSLSTYDIFDAVDEVLEARKAAELRIQATRVQCRECWGTGDATPPDFGGGNDCPACDGTGWTAIENKEKNNGR